MAYPIGAKKCLCVANHNPKPRQLHKHHIQPLYLEGPDTSENLIWLCPTAHANVHVLIRRWESNDGSPAWWTLKHFSPFIRHLAMVGWLRYKEMMLTIERNADA